MSDENEERGFRVRDRRGQPKEEPKPAEPQSRPREPENRGPQTRGQPQIDFQNFILSMSTSALFHMGLMEDPTTGRKEKNLPMAQQELAILEMLDRKTKGNLDPNEKKLMEDVLYELRVRFVEASR